MVICVGGYVLAEGFSTGRVTWNGKVTRADVSVVHNAGGTVIADSFFQTRIVLFTDRARFERRALTDAKEIAPRKTFAMAATRAAVRVSGPDVGETAVVLVVDETIFNFLDDVALGLILKVTSLGAALAALTTIVVALALALAAVATAAASRADLVVAPAVVAVVGIIGAVIAVVAPKLAVAVAVDSSNRIGIVLGFGGRGLAEARAVGVHSVQHASDEDDAQEESGTDDTNHDESRWE
mmetsp:Transcript_34536/g.75917  ORF Transcript_34536/g.75917 Transcript_34536/m.75917 type:complete len:239 (-) Transcript_34536:170-886(-)